MNEKAKTKKELLDELTALQQELENFQSANAGLQKDKETLEKREKFISNIFSSIQEGISVIDKEMNILFVNPTMERWFPDVRPLIGKKCFQAYQGRDQVCEVCPCRQTLQSGQAANAVIPSLDAKGEITGWFHHFSFPMLDPETGGIRGVIEYTRNVTKLKQAEDDLTFSEEKYRSILENLADGYFEVDLTGKFTFVNDAMTRTFGYTQEEMLLMDSQSYSDAENAKIIFQTFNRVYRTGKPVKDILYETITKNGGRRSIETSASLIKNPSGKPIGFRGIARDITELRQTQTALQQSEERYRTIIETMEEGYYENDLAGNLTFVNSAMAQFLGYSREEMLGMNNRQYIDAENAKIIYQAFNRVYRTGKPARALQYEVITKNGEKKTVETSPSLIRDPSGKPVGFRGTSRDITEVMQFQNALKASEERYRTIIETMEDAYFEVDLAGNFTFFNDAMFKIIEYTRDEMLGANFQQYTDAENAKKLFEAFNQVYLTGEPIRSIQYNAFNKSGVIRNIITSVTLIRDASGKPVGFRGVSRDITDLIQAQEALRKSEERYRTIIETIEDGYAEVDLEGNFTFFNNAMVRIFEYPRDEMMGMNNRQYTDAANAKILYQAFAQAYRTGEPSKGTRFEMITKDKKKKYLEVSNALIRDASGNVIGFRGITRDITDLIQTQRELKESEERYRTIIETIADGYYEVDLAGNMTFFNDQMAKIYDYPKEALMGMNNRVYTDAENAKKMYQAFNRVYRSGEPDSGVRFETITSEKTRKNMELSISLIRDASGTPVGFRGIARDITDLIQIQNELQRSEERYRTIIETIEDGYYEVDMAGNFTFFNDALSRIHRDSRDKMMGMNYREYTDDENAKIINQEFSRVYRTGEPSKGIHYEVITKNGRWDVEASVSLIRDLSGKPIGFRGISRDITELIQIQTALTTSEERYRTIIETIEDGYYETDLAGNLTFFNDAMARINSYSREEMMGMHARDYTDAENTVLLNREFIQVYRTRTPSKGIPYEVITKNGERKNVETSVSLIRDHSGKPIGFRGIARDITNLIQIQNELRRSEERYRTIIETIEDGYYETDLAGNLTYFNDTMVRIHEYSREELLGMNNRQYADAQNAKILFQEFSRVYRTGEPSKGTYYEIITKSGGRKNLAASVSLIRDSKGNIIGFRGIVRDVTEIRKAEQALLTSEERFRVAAESSNDFIYEWDIQSGRIDWFGKAVERFGDILGELPDTNAAFVKKIYPEDLEGITQAVRRHLKQGEPHLEEYRLVGKDGNFIHVKSAGMCLRNEDGRAFKWIGALSDITERKRSEEELKESVDKLHKSMGGIIQAMALTVESKDPYTGGHQQRVSNLARSIAQEMGLSKDQVEAIRMAGVVHDLGKISVPAEILSKPTKLSDLEFSLIKGHSQTSYDILKDIDFPWPIAEIALQHHERLNGSGYPSGLKGEQILLEAQILMVADVVEAIASHRPYRPALGIEIALDEISKNKGKLYNPAAVDACIRLFTEKGFSFG